MKTKVSMTFGALAAAFALAACQPAIDPIVPDLERPYVVGVVPSGNAVEADAEFVIRFSKPIQERTVFWFDEDLGEDLPEGIVLALGDDEEYMRKAANAMPLTVTQRKKSIPLNVKLNETRELATVTPMHPLEGLTDYVLIVSRKVRDDHFNSLIRAPGHTTPETMVFAFTTAPAPDLTPPKAYLKNPQAGSLGVSIEQGEVVVEFSEPIASETLTTERIGLKVRGTSDTLFPESVSLDGLLATLALADDTRVDCDKLCLDQEYELWVSNKVEDLAGNATSSTNFADEFFKSAVCIDEHAPRIADSSLETTVSDVSITVTWRTDEASTSQVQLVEGDADAFLAACDEEEDPTAACITRNGEGSACQADVCELPESQSQWLCEHSVKVTGLTPSTLYALRVVSADAGNRSVESAVIERETLAPLPKIVINEVLATPKVSDVNFGRFIELTNVGEVDADLVGEGWALARCDTPDCASGAYPSDPWTLKAASEGASTTLRPGETAVVGGDKFSPSQMSVVAEAMVLKGRTSTMSWLTKTTAYTYVLLSPGGDVVSSYGGWLGKPDTNDGKSFERIDPLGPDEASNWALSTAEVSGAPGNFATPGRKNSVSE